MILRRLPGVGAAALAASACASASAQDMPERQGEGPTAASTETSCQDEACLADILVTARRRVEVLQRAGIPVSTVDRKALQSRGVTDPRDLTILVPSLTVQPVDISTSFSIRGVGALAINAFQENAVAYNVDEVYFGRPSAPAGTLFDIERVEVLKGPQGTLYGRNATGGAVNVITRQPQLGETALNLSAEIGNYATRKLQGGINLPLGDDIAVRVAGQFSRHDGYLSDGYDDENIRAVRAHVLLAPSDRFSMTLSGDFARIGGRGKGAILFPSASIPVVPEASLRIGAADPRITQILQDRTFAQFRSVPPFAGFSDDQIRNFVTVPLDDGFQRSEFWGVSLKTDGDMGFAQLRTVFAYRKSQPDLLTYNPGFPSRIVEDSDQLTAEVSLAGGATGGLEYAAGLYYLHDRTNSFNNYDQGALASPEYFPLLTTESIAPYGSFTWRISPSVRASGGGRFTRETKSLTGAIRNRTAFLPDAPLVPISGDQQTSRFNWNAELEVDVGAQSLAYASVATGFKSGGFFPSAGDNEYGPETLTAFTLGTKNRLLSDSLQINIEAFYWRYRDQQISYIGPIEASPGNFAQAGVTVNAGRARMFGAEMELLWKPSPDITLSADVQYLDARYQSLVYDAISASGAPLPTTCLATDDPRVAAPPIRLFIVDCSGKPALNAPRWTANLGYRHSFDIGNGLKLVAEAHSRLESSSFLNLDYLDDQKRSGYTQTGASLELAGKSRRWAVTAFVENLEDRVVKSAGLTRPIINVSLLSVREPRTYGLRLSWKFGRNDQS